MSADTPGTRLSFMLKLTKGLTAGENAAQGVSTENRLSPSKY